MFQIFWYFDVTKNKLEGPSCPWRDERILTIDTQLSISYLLTALGLFPFPKHPQVSLLHNINPFVFVTKFYST